jgi:hypothetical protein
MTTISSPHPHDPAPGQPARFTLTIGESLTGHEVTVTLLTQFVQKPAYFEGSPDDLHWWQFLVTENAGTDTLEFVLNHPYPELRFHNTLIHLEKGAHDTATIVLRPLPPRPVPITEDVAVALASDTVLKTVTDFSQPVADQRVLEDRVWEIRVISKSTRCSPFEVQIDAFTGKVLSVEPSASS